MLSLFTGFSANAATLQIDFGTSFGDPGDGDTAPPAGPSPWLTAFFDDGDTVGSVTLTITVAGTVGSAQISEIYLNVDDVIGAENLIITTIDETDISPGAGISQETANPGSMSGFKADADGWYDFLFDLPIGGANDPFTAGETLIYSIDDNGAGLLLASSFAELTVPDPVDPNGPYYGAAKVQSITGCANYTPGGDPVCSDWIGADTTLPPSEIPVPAAVWLFASGLLLGMAGVARRKKT